MPSSHTDPLLRLHSFTPSFFLLPTKWWGTRTKVFCSYDFVSSSSFLLCSSPAAGWGPYHGMQSIINWSSMGFPWDFWIENREKNASINYIKSNETCSNWNDKTIGNPKGYINHIKKPLQWVMLSQIAQNTVVLIWIFNLETVFRSLEAWCS